MLETANVPTICENSLRYFINGLENDGTKTCFRDTDKYSKETYFQSSPARLLLCLTWHISVYFRKGSQF